MFDVKKVVIDHAGGNITRAHISDRLIREAVYFPTKVSKLESEEGSIRARCWMKLCPGAKCPAILATGSEKPRSYHVSYAYRIPEEVFDEALEPLEQLRRFLDVFGVDIEAGNVTGRLITYTEVKIPATGGVPLLGMPKRVHGDVEIGTITKDFSRYGERFVELVLAYGVHLDPYFRAIGK